MIEECQARAIVKHAQCGDLRPREPADEQDTSRHQGATQRRRKALQRRFQNVRDHEIKARAPVIRRFTAEVNFNPMVVQVRMRLGARHSDGIDICSDDAASAAGTGDSGKDSRTRSNVQNRLRWAPPAKHIHGCGTQPRGRVRSVSEDSGTIRPRQLCECYPAFSHRRRRRAGWIYRDSGSDVIGVKHLPPTAAKREEQKCCRRRLLSDSGRRPSAGWMSPAVLDVRVHLRTCDRLTPDRPAGSLPPCDDAGAHRRAPADLRGQANNWRKCSIAHSTAREARVAPGLIA
jgi:hypothetical protein